MAEERLEEIRKLRLEKRQKLIDAGQPPYPAEVRRTHTIKEILKNFDELEQDTTPLMVLGRVMSIRAHGGVVFLDVRDASGELQLQIARNDVEGDAFERLDLLDAGDWIQAAGMAGKTKRGVNTLMVTTWHVVSKAVRPIPNEWYGLKDHETRYREREVDLLLNEDVKKVFVMRSRIIHWLREYLTIEGFLEVETPTLQIIPGGAMAKPFETHHNALDMTLYMRIAPELYLKRLIVAGYEKVFDIGKNFRNEGVDRQHNPEFTMLEFYQAYADYEDLMDMTEKMLSRLVKDIFSKSEISWQGLNLSFEAPFKRVRYVDLVSEELGVDILEDKNPETYLKMFDEKGLEYPDVQSYAQLVDELYKELIRPTLQQPTLLYDYPTEMFPLAKRNLHDQRIAETFQLLVTGLELVKAYTELNDPVEQRKRFEEQMERRDEGDPEAQRIDEDYLRAMEYGMPPVAGWGMGIDRLVMLLTDAPSIRDTILFPLLRPETTTPPSPAKAGSTSPSRQYGGQAPGEEKL